MCEYISGESVREEYVPNVKDGVQLEDAAEESHDPLHHDHLQVDIHLRQMLMQVCCLFL